MFLSEDRRDCFNRQLRYKRICGHDGGDDVDLVHAQGSSAASRLARAEDELLMESVGGEQFSDHRVRARISAPIAIRRLRGVPMLSRSIGQRATNHGGSRGAAAVARTFPSLSLADAAPCESGITAADDFPPASAHLAQISVASGTDSRGLRAPAIT